jgi:hypothetical protein
MHATNCNFKYGADFYNLFKAKNRLKDYDLLEFSANQKHFDEKCQVFIQHLTGTGDDDQKFSIGYVTMALARKNKNTACVTVEDMLDIEFNSVHDNINMSKIEKSCSKPPHIDKQKKKIIVLSLLLRVCTLLFNDNKLSDSRDSLMCVGLAIQAHIFKKEDKPPVRFPCYSKRSLQYFYLAWSECLHLNLNLKHSLSDQIDMNKFDDVENIIFYSSTIIGLCVSKQIIAHGKCDLKYISNQLPSQVRKFDESRLRVILLRACVVACQASPHEGNENILENLKCLAIQCISEVIIRVKSKDISAHFWCAFACFEAYTKYNTTSLQYWVEGPIVRRSETYEILSVLSSICNCVPGIREYTGCYQKADSQGHPTALNNVTLCSAQENSTLGEVLNLFG